MASDSKIQFRCPHCEKALGVPAVHAGTRGKCPHCRKPIDIPRAKSRNARNQQRDSAPRKRKERVRHERDEEKLCDNCDCPMEPGAVLCVECGFNTATGDFVEESASLKRRKKHAKRRARRTENELTNAYIYLAAYVGGGIAIGLLASTAVRIFNIRGDFRGSGFPAAMLSPIVGYALHFGFGFLRLINYCKEKADETDDNRIAQKWRILVWIGWAASFIGLVLCLITFFLTAPAEALDVPEAANQKR